MSSKKEPYPYHCVGIFRPGDFKDSTDSTSFVPGSKPMIVDPEEFNILPGSSWDSWPPERVKAAKAQRRAWQLAAQKSYSERSAAAAAAPGAYRFDEPEPGATPNDNRVYTKLKSGEFKYWGIRDDDMKIEDFWAKFDPENTRLQDDNEDNPLDLGLPENGSSSNNPTPRTSADSGSAKVQKIPQIDREHRGQISPSVPPRTNKRARRSLAEVGGGVVGLDKQVSDVPESTSKSRRPVAHLINVEESDAHATGPRRRGTAMKTSAKKPSVQSSGKPRGRGRPRKVQPSILEPTSSNIDLTSSTPAKRKRGRPAKTKNQSKPSAKQGRPAAESKAKITKPKQKKQRSQAPSIHAMRTRAKGPPGRRAHDPTSLQDRHEDSFCVWADITASESGSSEDMRLILSGSSRSRWLFHLVGGSRH
ncbi:hypothetical protein BDR22DRAFT_816646 [Usnea florida]